MVYNQKIVKIKPLRDNVEQSQKIATGFSYYQDEIIVRKKNVIIRLSRKRKLFYRNTVVIPKMVGDELV